MLAIIISFGFVGGLFAFISVLYSLLVLLLYGVYRLDGGKMSLREYFKYW